MQKFLSKLCENLHKKDHKMQAMQTLLFNVHANHIRPSKITHVWSNSNLWSLRSGVSSFQVALPVEGDQHGNSAEMVRLGMARQEFNSQTDRGGPVSKRSIKWSWTFNNVRIKWSGTLNYARTDFYLLKLAPNPVTLLSSGIAVDLIVLRI